MKRASELDPLSAGITSDVGLPLTFQAKYEAAKEQARKALELDPNFYIAHWNLGWTDIEAGKFSAAIPEMEQARVTDSPPFVGWLGYAYAAAGERAKAEAMIAELNQMSSRRFVSPFCTAIIYLGLGDKERALDRLENAYEVRSQWLPDLLKVDRVFDPLRTEPRFIELLKKVHLDK
jgi:tetratricopeptide (TPR) repeat protein